MAASPPPTTGPPREGGGGSVPRSPLLNLRKASGDLPPTTRRFAPDAAYRAWDFASEWACRTLERELQAVGGDPVSLDEILCDPSLAARFDELAMSVRGGFTPADHRSAALAIRKRRGKTADARLLKQVRLSRQLTLSELQGDLPASPGVYTFLTAAGPLFCGEADDLAAQLDRHREAAAGALVPDAFRRGLDDVTTVQHRLASDFAGLQKSDITSDTVRRETPALNINA